MTTILSILQRSTQSRPLAETLKTTVFNIDDPRLTEFVLRVANGPNPANLDHLTGSSEAKLPNDKFNGINYGHIVVNGNGFTINIRQSGNYSWDDVFQLFPLLLSQPEVLANEVANTSERIANIDLEHYKKLIQDASFLHSIGHPLDYGGANVKFDEDGFRLLDIEGNSGSLEDNSFYSLAGLLLKVNPNLITDEKYNSQKQRAYNAQAQILIKLLDAAEKERLYLGCVFMDEFYKGIFKGAGLQPNETEALLARIEALENNKVIEDKSASVTHGIRETIRLDQSIDNLYRLLNV